MNWISRSSSDTKSKTNKCNKKDTKSNTSEVKGKTVYHKQKLMLEGSEIKDTTLNKEMATVYPMAASKPHAVKRLDGGKDASKSCLRSADKNDGMKENGPLWSELVEEEEQQKVRSIIYYVTYLLNKK